MKNTIGGLFVALVLLFVSVGCDRPCKPGDTSCSASPTSPSTMMSIKPVISRFTATPNTACAGQNVSLDWNTSNATKVTIAASAGPSFGSQALNGNTIVNPQQTTTYTLIASNANGLSDQSATSVTVVTSSCNAPATVTVNFHVKASCAGENIAGATVVANGVTHTTDPGGNTSFSVASNTQLNYNVTAAGYSGTSGDGNSGSGTTIEVTLNHSCGVPPVVTPPVVVCEYAVPSAVAIDYPAASNSGIVVSTNHDNCPWSSVSNNVPNLTLRTSSGTTNGRIEFDTTANATTSQRVFTITFTGLVSSGVYVTKTITVTQAPGPAASTCSYAVQDPQPSEKAPDYMGANTGIAVSASAGCAWSVSSSHPDWASITIVSPGPGNGSFRYFISGNGGGSRTVDITVTGQGGFSQTIKVVQGAHPF